MSLPSEAELRKQTLDTLLPDTLFTGSIQDIESRVNETVSSYQQRIPQIPELPSIGSLVPRYIPPIPTYGEIKELIHNRIKEIKKQKQEAFISAQNELVEKSKDSFTYRQQLLQTKQATQNVKNVLGRFNNQ